MNGELQIYPQSGYVVAVSRTWIRGGHRIANFIGNLSPRSE